MSDSAISQAAPLPPTGFLRESQILGNRRDGTRGLLPFSKSTWWQGIKDGRFPAPVKLGPAISAWRVEDIRALIERLSAQQPGSTAAAVNRGERMAQARRQKRLEASGPAA
jgi:prophage regulatory protein